MRKFLIPLLLASALAPAAASAGDDDSRRNQRAHAERGDRDHSSDKKAERSNDRPARAERPERPVRVERAERPVHTQRVDRPARIERVERVNRHSDGDGRIERRARRPVIQNEPVRQVEVAEPVQRVRTTRRDGDGFVGGLRDAVREQSRDRNYDRDRNRDRDRWRDGDRRHRWSGDWRRDRRYDWYNYRNRYSSLFRLGRYYDPYGWGYRRFSIGFSLWPSYYGSNYWLNDPWRYRLPPAYGPYRWVRYYDDALLVNIYTGEVVDVLHNFFW